jgi:hypothetical protein
VVLGIWLLARVAAAQDAPALKSQKEKLSYALGMDLGHQLRKLSIDVDPVVFGQGLKDALSGSKTLLTEEGVRAAVPAAYQPAASGTASRCLSVCPFSNSMKRSRQQTKISPGVPVRIMGAGRTQNGLVVKSRLPVRNRLTCPTWR